MQLNFDSMRKALLSLESALSFGGARLGSENVSQAETNLLRAGIVQNFEICYELCWKHMKRWLEYNTTPGSMEGISRKQLFRYALENHLIDGFDNCTKYHELRNLTTHTYNEEIALDIVSASEDFLKDARKLLSVLEGNND